MVAVIAVDPAGTGLIAGDGAVVAEITVPEGDGDGVACGCDPGKNAYTLSSPAATITEPSALVAICRM